MSGVRYIPVTRMQVSFPFIRAVVEIHRQFTE
ncbi:MAG: hypothetical protein ACI91V_001061 [Lentimonas sp.]